MADVKLTTYTAGASTTRKPDVYDVITNIAPDDTPFLAMMGRSKATSTKHEWPKDTLRKGKDNAQIEGLDVEAIAVTLPTMADNVTQIFLESFMLSDTAQAVKNYGRGDEIAYHTKKKLKEIALDMEHAFVNNTAKVVGDASTARKAVGLKGCITTNTYDFGGFNTTNLLTETIFNETMQKAKVAGGNPTKVLCPYSQKNTIDKFDGFNQLTKNIDSKSKTVVAAVDFYNGSFGTVEIVLHRDIVQEVSTKNYDTMYFIEPERYKLAPLLPVKTEELARTGLARKFAISGEATMEFLAEEGSAKIEKLYDPQQA